MTIDMQKARSQGFIDASCVVPSRQTAVAEPEVIETPARPQVSEIAQPAAVAPQQPITQPPIEPTTAPA